jgi:hypothetical protein
LNRISAVDEVAAGNVMVNVPFVDEVLENVPTYTALFDWLEL